MPLRTLVLLLLAVDHGVVLEGVMRFRNLERYKVGGHGSRLELRVPLPHSPTGKIYRFCPNSTCEPRLFLLGERLVSEFEVANSPLVRRQPNIPGITCPYCGHDDDDSEFLFQGDIIAAQNEVERLAAQDVQDQLADIVRRFNRKMSSSKSLIDVRMEVKRSPTRRRFNWRPDLLRNLACNICGREYGVYTIALFCPDCGARNVAVHFQREIELIRQQIDIAAEANAADRAELGYRLLGNAHEDVLTAFETYLKSIYRFFAIQSGFELQKKPRPNAFQSLLTGRKLFLELGVDPYAAINEDDFTFLSLNIQKRHVIGHNLGMVDEAYKEFAAIEQPGQTVHVLSEEISRFAGICQRIIEYLEQDVRFLPNAVGAPAGDA
jgi:hypothetical protein